MSAVTCPSLDALRERNRALALAMRARLCDWVTAVHTAYPPPRASESALTGMKTRSGLKMVTTRKRIRKNLTPSRERWIFECPTRSSASAGSNATL